MPTTTQGQETLTGVLERIIFFNEENAYCVAELSLPEQKTPATIQGRLPGVQCGETLELHGQWKRHPKHGDQFEVGDFESKLPASVQGIRKYLGSGLVPGIGKSYARKIVDHFGADTLRIIGEESGRLHEVPGIGKQRAKSIKEAWDEQRAVRDVMLFLQTYGVTPAQCVRLVKKYGSGAKKILQEEPYRLAEDIERIGFKTADKIALNLGLPSQSDERLDAGLLHVMQQIEDEGHTLATVDTLIANAGELLSVGPDLLRPRIRAQVERQKLIPVEAYDENLEYLGPACQLPPTAKAEHRVAEALRQIAAAPSALPPIKTEPAIEWAGHNMGLGFAPQQARALRSTLESKITIITGGPGTGKTTILRALVDILAAKKTRVLLASPTGRAAQRLSEAAGIPAATVHRLLKYDGNLRAFAHNKDNPLPCDLIILDEASMLDTRLAASLFQAIPPAAHLLLVGDADQLPSVGPGNLLGDLMNAAPAQVTRLDTIYRQEEQSGIVTTAHAILQGESHPGRTCRSLRDLRPADDFTFVETNSAEQTLQAILYIAREHIPKQHQLDPIKNLQVLSPMHRGEVGTTALNNELQRTLNPPEAARSRLRSDPGYAPARQTHFRETTRRELPFQLDYARTTFRLGDKVIQTRNNYDKSIFNGDTGIIRAIHPDASGLTVEFNGETVEFAKGELSEIQLAYAVTIHKSQGSEYPAVIIPLLKQHYLLLQRNLLYTGITRARRKVFLIGAPDAYAMAVRNNETRVRRTHLRARLRNPPT